jgi:hypothetical protein
MVLPSNFSLTNFERERADINDNDDENDGTSLNSISLSLKS